MAIVTTNGLWRNLLAFILTSSNRSLGLVYWSTGKSKSESKRKRVEFHVPVGTTSAPLNTFLYIEIQIHRHSIDLQ